MSIMLMIIYLIDQGEIIAMPLHVYPFIGSMYKMSICVLTLRIILRVINLTLLIVVYKSESAQLIMALKPNELS